MEVLPMRFDMWKSKAQKGAFLVLIAVLAPFLVLFAAFAADLGEIWAYHSKLQNAADAAALAGAGNWNAEKGDQILETIDDENHSHADSFAKKYVKSNLGDGSDASGNGSAITGRYLARTITEKDSAETNNSNTEATSTTRSYYRVELTRTIPLLKAYSFLGHPDFLNFDVHAVAVATIPVGGNSSDNPDNPEDVDYFNSIISVGNYINGSVNQGNNDYNNTIRGATFDSTKKVVVDYNFLDYLLNSSPWSDYSKFYTDAAAKSQLPKWDIDRGSNRGPNGESNYYYRNLELGRSQDYVDEIDKTTKLMEELFAQNQSQVKEISVDRNTIAKIDGSSKYYKVVNTQDQLNIDLYNVDGDTNDPVYVYVDANTSAETGGGVSLLKLNLRENITRPIIFFYPEYHHRIDYPWWHGDSNYATNIQFDGTGYNFNGVLYGPYSNAAPFKYENGNFVGSMTFYGLQLQANFTHFTFKQFEISSKKGGSGNSNSGSQGGDSVKLQLVNNDIWNTNSTDNG